MKKLIRWMADVSGVTREIETKAYKHAGCQMYQNAFWWNGGSQYNRPKWEVFNAFMLYSHHLMLGWPSPYGDAMSQIRTKVYEADDDQLPVEVYDPSYPL